MIVPYHDKLDVDSIVITDTSKQEVAFVVVPQHKKTLSYEQVKCVDVYGRDIAISKLRVCGPTDDAPYYSGYVELEEPVNKKNKIDSFSPKQAQSKVKQDMQFIFNAPDITITFLKSDLFVDVFNEHGLYFVADCNTIEILGKTYENGKHAGNTSNA